MTPDLIQQVYAFETIYPKALKYVFAAYELKAFTLTDTPDLVKDRPRSEIMFTNGQGQGIWRQVSVDGGITEVETSWKGQFEITVVTNAEVAKHIAYIAQVRWLMHRMGCLINGVAAFGMTRHRIQPEFLDAGTQSDFQPQDGAFLSRLLFDVNHSIQDDAWESIES